MHWLCDFLLTCTYYLVLIHRPSTTYFTPCSIYFVYDARDLEQLETPHDEKHCSANDFTHRSEHTVNI